MIKRSYLLILFCAFITPIFAQHEFGLHFLRDNWHSNETNPAFIRDTSSGAFRLPGLYNGLFLEGPSYNQLVTKENGEPVININSAINFLESQNVIADDFELQTIGFAIPIKDHFVLSFGHSIKYFAFFKYPKELAQVIYQGNAQFIGETINIGNELQVTGFHSLDLGGIYKINNLSIGAKVKYMSGFVDITTDTDHKSVSLYTDPDIYEVTLEGDYVLNSSNALEYNSYNDFNYDLNFGTFTANNFFGGNTGVAFDLGLHYETADWDIAASVLNLSNGINWTTELANYSVQESYEYNGLDFSNAITGGDTPNLDASLDSIEQIFQPVETATEYTNTIPRKIYLSALYRYNEKLNIGAAFFNQSFRGETLNAFGLHFNYDLAKWFNLGLTYSATKRSSDNIGATFSFQIKSWQLFGTSDNLVDLIDPTNGNDFGLRLGGNIYF